MEDNSIRKLLELEVKNHLKNKYKICAEIDVQLSRESGSLKEYGIYIKGLEKYFLIKLCSCRACKETNKLFIEEKIDKLITLWVFLKYHIKKIIRREVV